MVCEMTPPGWNSLDTVQQVHSALELIAVIFFALLVVADIFEHWATKRAKLLKVSGLTFFALAILTEFAAYPYGRRGDKLSQDRIRQDELLIAQSNRDAKQAERDAEGFRLQIADATERVANAEKKAAEANRLAEQERLARVRIEQRMADRDITTDQRKKMLEFLRTVPGAHVDVDSINSEGREAFAYAGKIADLFRDAKWNVVGLSGRRFFSRPLAGILIDTQLDDAHSMELGELIARAFISAGIPVSRSSEQGVGPGTVLVLVGSK